MKKSFNDILVTLADSDESERCYAVECLQQFKDQEIIPLLIIALQDRSIRVRETAVDVLISIGGAEIAEATAELLSSENVPLRNAAIEILEKLGCASLDVLEKYIHSSSADVRKFSIDTVGKLIFQSTENKPRILAALVEHLSDEDVNVAGAAAEALGFAKDDWAIPFLLSHISGGNHSSWLQCSIIASLSRISSKKSKLAITQIDKTLLSSEAISYLEMALNGEVI